MDWLLAQQIRPFIRLAALASLLLNVAMLAPALYMLQVFERVFASGSVETLVMLGVPVLLMLVLGYYMDVARARTLAAAGGVSKRCLAPEALVGQLVESSAGTRGEHDALRDVAQLRKLLASAGVVALFDAPWVPVYLLIITVMHPLLGGIATLGARPAVRPRRVDRAHYAAAHRTGPGRRARRATQCRRTAAQRRNCRRHGNDP